MEQKYYENKTFEDLNMEYEQLEDYKLNNCIFKNCNFEECVLVNCSITECKFINCKIVSPKAEFSQVKQTEFDKCNLIGINWHDLQPAGNITDSIAKLNECIIKYNSFIDINFKKFNFSFNNIQDSVFEECNLVESSFKECKLELTQFAECDLRKADFQGATGYQISLTTNKLKDAKFSYPEVINLLSELSIRII